jgi:hypothetical protein
VPPNPPQNFVIDPYVPTRQQKRAFKKGGYKICTPERKALLLDAQNKIGQLQLKPHQRFEEADQLKVNKLVKQLMASHPKAGFTFGAAREWLESYYKRRGIELI